MGALDVLANLLLLGNLQYVGIFLFKFSLSFVLGCLIGLERGSKQPVAGVRTHMIIATGSCLISAVGADLVTLGGGGTGDATRLAGQILAGIGFVGAGVIIRRGAGVTTTAATIFLAAGVGISCGLGFYAFSILSTLMVGLGLFVIQRLFPLEEVPGKMLRITCTPDKLEAVKALLPPGHRLNAVLKFPEKIEMRVFVADLSWQAMDSLMAAMLPNPDVLSIQVAEERIL